MAGDKTVGLYFDRCGTVRFNDYQPNAQPMKLITNIVGGLLGLLFIVFGSNFFLNFIPMPADPSAADAPHKLFMAALFPTGYLAFVKCMEMLGGLLVAVPKTRNIGLLILGPIIVNILCYHVFLMKGKTLYDPMLIGICVMALFLLLSGRKAFAGLMR